MSDQQDPPDSPAAADSEQEDQPSEGHSPAAHHREAPSPTSAARPASDEKAAEKAADHAKAEKRREHLERALKASGKAVPAKAAADDEESDDAEDDGDDEEKGDAEDAEKPGKKDEDKADPLDKIRSPKHVRIAVKKLRTQTEALEERERKHQEQQAKDDRINQAATEKYGRFAEAAVAYSNKDYRGTAAALKGLFGDDFSTIARNIWNATKDGMAAADLKYEVNQLKAKLEGQGQKQEAEKQETAKASETKQLRAAFDKRVKSHELTAIGDEELNAKAFKLYQDSWDPDLEEHTLSAKKAADKVLEKERERARKLTGRRAPAPEPRARESRDASSPKPLREMSKEEKRKYHLERSLRQSQATARERQRHA